MSSDAWLCASRGGLGRARRGPAALCADEGWAADRGGPCALREGGAALAAYLQQRVDLQEIPGQGTDIDACLAARAAALFCAAPRAATIGVTSTGAPDFPDAPGCSHRLAADHHLDGLGTMFDGEVERLDHTVEGKTV